MNADLARMVAMTALRTRIELGDLMPLLRQHGEDTKDDPVREQIASAVYEVGLVFDRVFEQHAGLEAEIEALRQKYGRPHY